MSYEMVVMRFENGEAGVMDDGAFRAVWGPHIDRTEPEFNLWHVRVSDGGTAEIHGRVTGDERDGVTISRFSAGEILSVLVKFMVAADGVVLAPGCPTLLATMDQQRHLPAELRADVVVVRSGADVQRVLDES